MVHHRIVEKIREVGAFPGSLDSLCYETPIGLALATFHAYPKDISVSTGALYITSFYGRDDLDLIRTHLGNMQQVEPGTAVEMNNLGFAYENWALERTGKDEENHRWIAVGDELGIDYRSAVRWFEAAVEKDPLLLTARRNLARRLLDLASWGEDPEHDDLDRERAYEELDMLVRLAPVIEGEEDTDSRLALADYFYNERDPVKQYSEILEMDPGNERARDGLERFKRVGWNHEQHSTAALRKRSEQLRRMRLISVEEEGS